MIRDGEELQALPIADAVALPASESEVTLPPFHLLPGEAELQLQLESDYTSLEATYPFSCSQEGVLTPPPPDTEDAP